MMNKRDQLYSDYYIETLKKKFIFELKSFIGNALLPKTVNTDKKYINLGCGSIIKEKFLNIDFFKIGKKEKNFLGLDLRRKLPFKDEIFEGCFSEHAIEHLHFFECMNLIKEIYRTLKYNSVLRLIVPDLRKYIDNYNGINVNPNFDIFKIKSEGIWSIAQNYEHKSVWDFELITDLLNKVGFRDISLSQFNESRNKDLIIDRQDREWNSLYVEAIK
jgi:predicted SAM-dependent methyltransferase